MANFSSQLVDPGLVVCNDTPLLHSVQQAQRDKFCASAKRQPVHGLLANLVVVDHVSSILVHAASIIYYGVIFIIFFQRGMMTCRRVFRIANASIFACLPMCYVAALICAGCIHSRYIHSCGGQKKHLWTDNYPAKFRVYLRNASSERPGYRYLEINNPLDSSLFDTPATPTTGTGCSRQIHSRRPVSSWKPRILLTAQIDHDRFASWRGHGHAPGTGRRQCYD